jgi:hypothetical protein
MMTEPWPHRADREQPPQLALQAVQLLQQLA